MEEMGARTSRARERAKKCREACREDFINRLTHRGKHPIRGIGVDFAGPLKYRIRARTEGKAYLALCTYSLTRGLLLEVLPNLATSEFLRSLKRLIARRGRPEKIYSDNSKTFVGAEKWLKQVMREEKTQDYLAHENIK